MSTASRLIGGPGCADPALREALSLDHNCIGTEHLLLGLVRENESAAMRIRRDFDASPETIRSEVTGRLAAPRRTNQVRETRPAPKAGSGQVIDSTWLGGLGDVLNGLATEIHRRLGRAPDPGILLLLLLLASTSDTLAAQTLRELGIDLDQLAGVVERVRTRAQAEDELAPEIHELAQAKQKAIAKLTQLRAYERELREQAQARTVITPELIQ